MSDSRKALVDKVLDRLKRRYKKEMRTSLHHSSPWELLAATMLSAQSQDAQVNKATAKLFKRYKTVKDFGNAKPTKLYLYIRHLGLYRNKGKNIIKTAKAIHENFNDKVPKTMEELLTLPGVGRKTANVVLSNAYNIHYGIAIDTHCITVSNRLGLAKTKDPAKIERMLVKVVDKRDWKDLTHLFIVLGRDVCTARRKYCESCVLNDICPSSTVKK